MIGDNEPTEKKTGGALTELVRHVFSRGTGPPAGAELVPSKLTAASEAAGAAFVAQLVGKLGTSFATPEEEVIKQGEPGNDMYFLSKGDCAVNIKDASGRLHVAVSLLTEGDHFGEISLLYRCKRTATVVSRNYNTMARISQ
tara:strand:- start:242 stop:667 length:426 start_codon:yes stop_codon:yes gene_type:complete